MRLGCFSVGFGFCLGLGLRFDFGDGQARFVDGTEFIVESLGLFVHQHGDFLGREPPLGLTPHRTADGEAILKGAGVELGFGEMPGLHEFAPDAGGVAGIADGGVFDAQLAQFAIDRLILFQIAGDGVMELAHFDEGPRRGGRSFGKPFVSVGLA